MYIPRTERKWGAGDLVGLLFPSKWTESGKTYFQEPFFSKGVCGHRRKGSIREQLSFSTVSPPMKEYTHCECLTLSQPSFMSTLPSPVQLEAVTLAIWWCLLMQVRPYVAGTKNTASRWGDPSLWESSYQPYHRVKVIKEEEWEIHLLRGTSWLICLWAPLIFADSSPTNASSSFTWVSASQNEKEWTYDRSLDFDHKMRKKYYKLNSETHPTLILKLQDFLLTLCIYHVGSANVISCFPGLIPLILGERK